MKGGSQVDTMQGVDMAKLQKWAGGD